MSSETKSRIVEIVEMLGDGQRQSLLDYAQYLQQREGPREPSELSLPVPVARPAQESVVGAIKRLSSVYHMVDRAKMLHETSALMAEHLVQGREASEVIDELELLFVRYYEKQFASEVS